MKHKERDAIGHDVTWKLPQQLIYNMYLCMSSYSDCNKKMKWDNCNEDALSVRVMGTRRWWLNSSYIIILSRKIPLSTSYIVHNFIRYTYMFTLWCVCVIYEELDSILLWPIIILVKAHPHFRKFTKWIAQARFPCSC